MNDDPTPFDRLVEQQDQELAQDGELSPWTRMQLQASDLRRTLPPVEERPAFQRATARLHRLLQRMRQPYGYEPDEDDWRFDDQEEVLP